MTAATRTLIHLSHYTFVSATMKILFVLSLLFTPLLAGDATAAAATTASDIIDEEHRNLQGHQVSIEDWVRQRGSFTTLVDLLILTGLAPDGPLDGAGSFTAFAPSNNAFRDAFALYPGLDTVLTTPDADGGYSALTTVLQYHVLAAAVFANQIPRGGVMVKTLSGEMLLAWRDCYWYWGWRYCDVYLQDGSPDWTWVTHKNFRPTNGVIHAIDKVLIPPSLAPTVEGLRVDH